MADEEKSQNIDELIAQTEAALAANDAKAARKLADAVAEADPHHPKLHDLWEEVAAVKAFSQGISAADRQRFDVLRGLLKQWPASTRQTERYKTLAARIDDWVAKHKSEAEELQRTGRWFEAREAWDEVLKADPDNEEAKQGKHDCVVESIGQEARDLMRASEWDNAITKWDEMLLEFPDSEEAQKGKAEAVRQRDKKARTKVMLEIGAAAIVVIGIAVYLIGFYYPQAQRIDSLDRGIRTAIDHHDWRTAEANLGSFIQISPDEPEVPIWQRRISELKRWESNALKAQIDSAITVAEWDHAQTLVDSLAAFMREAPEIPDWREAIERGRTAAP